MRRATADIEHAESVPIRLVVALAAEAAPLVEAWMLERRSGNAFVWFEGEIPGSRNPVQLAVSGVGRARCAAAVGWLAGRDPIGASRAVWINLGIAGADRYDDPPACGDGPSVAEVGDVVLASAVRDTSRVRLLEAEGGAGADSSSWVGRQRVPCWYPPWLGKRPPEEMADSRGPRLVRAPVHTVDLPEVAFPSPGVYEMEAAAFLECAVTLASVEFVQVIKVVSDTPRTGLSVVDRESVEKRCAEAVPVVGRLAREFVQWRSPVGLAGTGTARWIEQWAERLRLSVTRRRHFARLIERALALHEAHARELDETAAPTSARAHLDALLEELDGDSQGPRVRRDARRLLCELKEWVDRVAIEGAPAGRHSDSVGSPAPGRAAESVDEDAGSPPGEIEAERRESRS